MVVPEWLKEQWQEDWIERYEHRVEDYRLPDGKRAREAYAIVIGKDGAKLLDALYADAVPVWLREIPAVQTLRRVWVQNFYWEEGELRWRELSHAPAAGALINSPYDPEALFAQKRETKWIGYKVQMTETCDDEYPHIITHLETVAAEACRGYRLCRCEGTRQQSARLRRGALWANTRGLSLASAGKQRLCCIALYHQLARDVCHVSSRQDE